MVSNVAFAMVMASGVLIIFFLFSSTALILIAMTTFRKGPMAGLLKIHYVRESRLKERQAMFLESNQVKIIK